MLAGGILDARGGAFVAFAAEDSLDFEMQAASFCPVAGTSKVPCLLFFGGCSVINHATTLSKCRLLSGEGTHVSSLQQLGGGSDPPHELSPAAGGRGPDPHELLPAAGLQPKSWNHTAGR